MILRVNTSKTRDKNFFNFKCVRHFMKATSKPLIKLLKLFIVYQEILMGANQMLSTYAVVFQETNLIPDLSTNRGEQL